MKTFVLFVFFQFFIFCSSFAQCTVTPQVQINGNQCVGSDLFINSNVMPEAVHWESNGNTISTQTITLNTNATTVAGGNGAGNAMNQLNRPDRLFVDAAGIIYVPDLVNNRVQKWLPGATSGVTVAGGNGAGSAANQFDRPSSVFVDLQGNIYVTDQNNARVQKWAPGATSGITVAGLNNELTYPTDVFIDKNGDMYVSDQLSYVVRKYPQGSTTGIVVAGNYNSASFTSTGLSSPTGICVDDAGNLYVCDPNNSRVQMFAPGSLIGVTIASGITPLDIAVDCSGNLFVVDYWGGSVIKYTAGSFASTVVAGGNGDGLAANQLVTPIGVFIVGNNSLYVADYGNHRVQKFATTINPYFIPNQAGVYTLTMDFPCCPSYTETIEIKNLQVPVTSIAATKASVCPGEQVNFTATNINNILNPVYEWKLNGNTINNTGAVYVTSSLKDKDRIYCILSSAEACTIPTSDTSNIIDMEVLSPVPLQLKRDVQICPGTTTILQVPSIYSTYLWQDLSTQSSLSVNKEGKYYVTVKDVCNNSYSDTVLVSYFKTATHFLPSDTTICSYDILPVKSSVAFSSYLWSSQSNQPSLIVNQPGLYWLEALDNNNCLVKDSILIQFKNCPPKGLYLPTAFSPNNDGLNDLFKPDIYGVIKNYRFAIYNRYGQVVFQSTEPSKGWNGKVNGQPVGTGVYVWTCTYDLEDKKGLFQKGTVTLIK